MSEKCELLNTCGFFINFRGNTEVVKQGWIKMFCESKENQRSVKERKLGSKQVNHQSII